MVPDQLEFHNPKGRNHMTISDVVNPANVPQSQDVAGMDMKPNRSGGFVFEIDNFDRLERFLVLGRDTGMSYNSVSSYELTLDSAMSVLSCAIEDGPRTIDTIVRFSMEGRIPKNDTALFAMALILSASEVPVQTRRMVADRLPSVARQQTDISKFVNYATNFRGWGKLMRRAVQNCYEARPLNTMAYHGVKYRNREGWTHRDLMLKAHIRTNEPNRNALYEYLAQHGKKEASRKTVVLPSIDEFRIIEGFEKVQSASTATQVAMLIDEYSLTREMIPTQFMNHPEVGKALLRHMPATAMLRSLSIMTKNGVITPNSPEEKLVVSKLTDAESIRRSRLHPIVILNALKTYEGGFGVRSQWTPVPKIIAALNKAFELSFQAIVPTGKRILIALDVSGSMDCGRCAGLASITPRDGAAAMSMATLRSEENCEVVGFSHNLVNIPLHSGMSLNEVSSTVRKINMGSTDCALPMLWAAEKKREFDAFIIYTDNETWHGNVHPYEALRRYRNKMGIPAKMAVVAFENSRFSIADPNDSGMMDFVGFDAAAPKILSDFIRG